VILFKILCRLVKSLHLFGFFDFAALANWVLALYGFEEFRVLGLMGLKVS
jgi:hypothetical protein